MRITEAILCVSVSLPVKVESLQLSRREVFFKQCGNIAINSLFNCFCIQKACSDVDDQATAVPEPDFDLPCNLGGISIIEDPEFTSQEKTTTLDSLFPSLEKLKLLKIDAEGMEEKILVGGRKLIKKLGL